jgi:hypothetical protein
MTDDHGEMKRVLSLSEVLVVCAICSIIGAVFFSVFGQIQNFKLQAYMSNMRLTGQGVKYYMSDFDDLWPMAMGTRPAPFYTWGYNQAYPVPADILDPASANGSVWASSERQVMANSLWINAFQPYFNDYSVFENPVATVSTNIGDEFVPNRFVPRPGIQMNGLLHSLNHGAINNPELVPAFWNVQKIVLRGRCFSSPALNCGGSSSGPTDCRFNPMGPPGPPASGTSGNSFILLFDFSTTAWQFGSRIVIGLADLSARVVPIGRTVEPGLAQPSSAFFDPWAQVNTNGVPAAIWTGDADCANNQTNSYYCYFRPDRTR